MSEATPTIFPWGVPEDDLLRLVAAGRLKGSLTMDDVVLVLRQVELTTEVIEGVRARLEAEGIVLDESVPPLDLAELGVPSPATPADPGDAAAERVPVLRWADDISPGLPASVEAELHEASEAADAAGDYEQDGPELGGVRPARSAAAPGRVLRAASSASDRGGSSDPVRMYLKEIGRVPLLTGAEEVEFSRRIEAGGFAAAKLADLAASGDLDRPRLRRAPLAAAHGARAARTPARCSSRPTCASSCRSPSATSAGACTSSTSSRRATSA